MNRSKQPMTRQAAKKMHKEVRSAGATLPSPSKEKILSKERSIVLAAMKKAQTKSKKNHHKHSKRATPSLVHFDESAPSNLHKEGKRWLKAVVRQGLTRGKQLAKHLLKKK